MLLAAAMITLTTLIFAHISTLGAQHHRSSWHFTAKEIEIAYRYQENYGKGLKQPLKAAGCMLGARDFSADIHGKQHRLPCWFIKETLRHLREILAAGAARYFFPLDLNHAHLAFPKTSWFDMYRKLPSSEILPAILRDRQLVALYHSAEHLKLPDPSTTRVNQAVVEWQEKRNILGYYDGRPIKILTPHPDGFGVTVPDRYWSYGGFEFLAGHGAGLPVIYEDSAVAVDIKLELGGAGFSAPAANNLASP